MVFCGSIHAQSNGNHALVNIENEYTPEIIKVNKKGNTPTVEEEIEVSPLELRFTDKVQPFKGFTSERDTKEAFPKQDEQYPGYVRLGYGFTNDIDAKAAYTLKTSKEGKMEILAGFDGFKTGVEGEENDWDQRMFRSMLGASYTHRFNSLEMGVNADFSNSVFNYQSTDGYNPGLTDKQNSRTYRLGTTGVSRLDGPFAYSYDAGITYNRRSYSSGSDEGTGELGFNIDSRISYQVGESLKELGVDLGFNGFMYNSRLRDADNGFSNFASFDVNPYLLFDFDIWRIKVGTKMNFVTANGPRFAIAPDIKVEGNLHTLTYNTAYDTTITTLITVKDSNNWHISRTGGNHYDIDLELNESGIFKAKFNSMGHDESTGEGDFTAYRNVDNHIVLEGEMVMVNPEESSKRPLTLSTDITKPLVINSDYYYLLEGKLSITCYDKKYDTTDQAIVEIVKNRDDYEPNDATVYIHWYNEIETYDNRL